jgi:hypothetical protein
MKTFFKPLAIAATLIATLTPAKAYLGVVDFTLPEPIGCRNLDDAIEASKFNGFEAEQRVYLPKIELLNAIRLALNFLLKETRGTLSVFNPGRLS